MINFDEPSLKNTKHTEIGMQNRIFKDLITKKYVKTLQSKRSFSTQVRISNKINPFSQNYWIESGQEF